MTNKLSMRLTLATVAFVVALAVVLGLVVTLTPATARADGTPISDVLSEYEYGYSCYGASFLQGVENGTSTFSTIDAGYSGTITATLYDMARESVVAEHDDYDYVPVGEYAILVEWSADGDFEAGSDWFDFEVTRYALEIEFDSMFLNDTHYGASLNYIGDTNYVDASGYLMGGLNPVSGDDVQVKLGFFVDGEGEPVRPVNAGTYNLTAYLEGNDANNYILHYSFYDENLMTTVLRTGTSFVDCQPFNLLPKYITVTYNLVYHDKDTGYVFKTVENIANYTTGIAYIGADFDVQAVTDYTEEIDGDDVAVVKPVITGWSAMQQSDVLVPNLPDEYRLRSEHLTFEALVDGVIASNYAIDPMSEFVFCVEKREVLFQQWIDTAPYRGGDATAPVYNFQPERSAFEDTNNVYLSYLPIDDMVWDDLEMQCSYMGSSFEVGDSLDVYFYLSDEDLALYELSGSSDPQTVHYTVVKADPIIGAISSHEQVETWYCFEPLGALSYTEFVKSKVSFNIKSYNDLENLQLDPTTWYYWDDDNETYVEGRLPANVNAGEYHLKVMTKATSNYNAKLVQVDVTITQAPIYAVWKEESTVFQQADYSVGPAANQFEYYVFEVKEGNQTYKLIPEVFDPYDSGYNFYSPAWLSGQTTSLYAGEFTAYLEITTGNDIDDRFTIVNTEFNWSVDYKYLTFAESTLNIPATFIYGGDDGNSYYAKPYIDYRKSSKTYDFINDEWVDPEDISVVSGEITGFEKCANQYRYPYEEKWEYNTVSALYDGEWTLWTNETYPKDKGNYFVRYSATFCYADWTYDEQGNQVPNPDTFDPSKGMFKVNYVYGAFTIQPKDVFVEWSNLEHDYDAQVHDAVVDAELCYGESVAEVITYTKGIKNAGEYTLNADISANYNISAGASATLSIAKVTLTVTADSKNAVYGDAVPQYTASIMGWQGDDEAALSDTLMAAIDWSDSTYAQYNDIGDYAIVAKGLTAANYNFEYENATLTVEPAVVNVVWAEPNYTYDGGERNIQIASVKGVQNEDIDLVVSCNETVKDAKSYTLVADKQYVNNNYTLANTEYVLTIAAKALTITPNDLQAKVYGDGDPVLTYAVTGGIAFAGEEPVFSGELSRVAGETVDSYSITLGSLAVNSNYVIETFVDNKVFSITKRTITVVPTGNQGKTFGEDDPVLTYDYTNKHPFENDDNKPVFSGALSRVAGEENGKYLITIGSLALTEAEINNNYQLSFDATVQFEIGKAAVDMSSVVFANASFTYDGQSHSITVSNLPSSIVGVAYTYNGESATGSINAGTYTVTATFTPDGDHRAPADMTATLTIGQRALVVTPDAQQSKIYGEADPVLGYAVSNNVEGETPVFVGALARAEGKNVGAYAINAGTLALSNAANVNKNYVWSFAADEVDFTITARTISYTLAEQTFTYGDEIVLTEPVEGGMGLADGDSRSDVYTITFNVNSYTGYGNYFISIDSKFNNNYDATLTGAYYRIAKAELTAVSVAQSAALTYNKAEQVAEVATAATAVNKQPVVFTYSKTQGSYGATVPAFTLAGTYTVYYQAAASNHNDYFGSFDVTIGKATYDMSGVVFADYNGIYDGEDHSIEAVNLPEGVEVSYVNNSIRNVGTVIVTANFAGDADNYFTIDSSVATMTITARTVTLVPAALSKVYGEEDPALTYEWSNIVETPVIYGSLYRVAGENAGAYMVKVDQIGFTNAAVNNNYELALDDTVEFTINTRAITVTVDAKSSVYGEEKVELTAVATLDGNANGIAIMPNDLGKVYSLSCAVNAEATVGTYDIVGKSLSANYSITFANEEDAYEVLVREVTLSWTGADFIYDADAHQPTVVVGNLVNEDAIVATVAGFGTYYRDTAYTATATALTGDKAANYVLPADTAFDFTIRKRDVTIVVDNKTSVYGENIVEPTSTATGFATAEDEAQYWLAYEVDEVVGEYDIVATWSEADGNPTKIANNYNITVTNGTYTITNATITGISAAQSGSLTYNAAEQVATVATAATAVNEQAITFTYSKTAAGTFAATVPSFKDAGEYTVYYKVNAANHNEESGSFKVTIGKKALTVSADNKSITYGDYAPTYTESYEGFAGSEDKAVLGGTLTLTCSYKQYDKAGSYTITPAGYTSANYDITFVNGTLTVAAGEFDAVEVKEDGAVEVAIDNAAASSAKGVDINKIIESAAKAGDNAGLTLTLGEGNTASTIVLDASAIAALKDKDVKLGFEVKKGDDAAAAVKGAALVLEINLSGMDNGTATITVPFVNEAPTGKVAKVFYVDENGKKTDMEGVFENDTVKFTTTHNSQYIVSYVLSTATIAGIAVAAVAVVAIVVVLVIVMGKKKKGAAPAPKAEEAAAEDAE